MFAKRIKDLQALPLPFQETGGSIGVSCACCACCFACAVYYVLASGKRDSVCVGREAKGERTREAGGRVAREAEGEHAHAGHLSLSRLLAPYKVLLAPYKVRAPPYELR